MMEAYAITSREEHTQKIQTSEGAERLKRWMEGNNTTVKQLARRTGYSKEYIKRVLRQEMEIKVNFAVDVSYTTGIPVKDLLPGKQPHTLIFKPDCPPKTTSGLLEE